MTRVLAVTTGLLLCVLTYATFRASPIPSPASIPTSVLSTGSALDTDLALEPSEYQPVMDAAYKELAKRNADYHAIHWWSRAIGYTGLALTSLLTIVAGFYGIHGDSGHDELQSLLREQKQSKGLTRIVGVLIALTTLPSALAQRMDTDAASVSASGRELWQAIDAAEQKIIDPNATEAAARSLLLKVKEATNRTW